MVIAVQHARLTHGKIGDVDHLLHFAQPLGQDLAVLERHERAEVLLRASQLLAQDPDQLAALGSRHVAPQRSGGYGALKDVLQILVSGRSHLPERLAARRILDADEFRGSSRGPSVSARPRAAVERCKLQTLEQRCNGGGVHRCPCVAS